MKQLYRPLVGGKQWLGALGPVQQLYPSDGSLSNHQTNRAVALIAEQHKIIGSVHQFHSYDDKENSAQE